MPLGGSRIDRIVIQYFTTRSRTRMFAQLQAETQTLLCQFVHALYSPKAVEAWLLHDRHPARRTIADLNKMNHSSPYALLNDLEAFQRFFVDRQAEPGSAVIEVDISINRDRLAIEDIPEQFVAHFNVYSRKKFRHRRI